MKKGARIKIRSWAVLLINLLLVVAIIALFFYYIGDYNKKIYEQNLNDICNINEASARIASELSFSQVRKINNISRYISRHTLTTEELLEFIDDFNSDDVVSFHLIGDDYTGYVIKRANKGEFPPVSYQNNDYTQIHEIVDSVGSDSDSIPFTVEFTDPNTGMRSFARYIYITATDNGEVVNYTLLAVFHSDAFSERINLHGNFEGMDTVLINRDGGYALRNSEFKSDNFYKSLYVYNDLTLDEMHEIQSQIESSDKGTLRYLSGSGKDCAFAYSAVPGTGWKCISRLPIDNFHNSDPNFTFTAVLALMLIIMSAVDISFLYKLNLRLKQSASEANAANEAKTDFLSRMSHDIRTPINVISGMTQLALEEDDAGRITEYLKNIQTSGKFLLGLVNDILDMNKVESGNMQLHLKPYRGKELLSYVDAVIRPLCDEKGITFSVVDNSNDIAVMLDPLRFNQIAFNLLSNAVKFTDAGGQISLKISAHALSQERAAIEMIVSDNGSGMSDEFQKTMFAPFSQEERTVQTNTSGTGLGLAIVKNLADLMGGTIRVESAIGQGTTFFINMEADITLLENKEGEQDEASDISGCRILLCEDHPLNAQIIVRLLARRSVDVETAENGKIGFEKFQSSPKGWYDAILMDMRMPVMNGLEATKAIRSISDREDAASVPIIALTANAYDSDVKNCLEAGMNRHIAKPVSPQELYDVLSHEIKK